MTFDASSTHNNCGNNYIVLDCKSTENSVIGIDPVVSKTRNVSSSCQAENLLQCCTHVGICQPSEINNNSMFGNKPNVPDPSKKPLILSSTTQDLVSTTLEPIATLTQSQSEGTVEDCAIPHFYMSSLDVKFMEPLTNPKATDTHDEFTMKRSCSNDLQLTTLLDAPLEVEAINIPGYRAVPTGNIANRERANSVRSNKNGLSKGIVAPARVKPAVVSFVETLSDSEGEESGCAEILSCAAVPTIDDADTPALIEFIPCQHRSAITHASSVEVEAPEDVADKISLTSQSILKRDTHGISTISLEVCVKSPSSMPREFNARESIYKPLYPTSHARQQSLTSLLSCSLNTLEHFPSHEACIQTENRHHPRGLTSSSSIPFGKSTFIPCLSPPAMGVVNSSRMVEPHISATESMPTDAVLDAFNYCESYAVSDIALEDDNDSCLLLPCYHPYTSVSSMTCVPSPSPQMSLSCKSLSTLRSGRAMFSPNASATATSFSAMQTTVRNGAIVGGTPCALKGCTSISSSSQNGKDITPSGAISHLLGAKRSTCGSLKRNSLLGISSILKTKEKADIEPLQPYLDDPDVPWLMLAAKKSPRCL
ncbi:unnamed protein product [Phytomonas sp. EM1]|nr:unnamed protein product [Phytomonas sp. EM1]|eukprot:CCW59651.1 unnamed protein product [Phytomonas sp. isolate EM1]